MASSQPTYKGMTLFTQGGERKYLSERERKRFLAALPVLRNAEAQTFCETLYWTGCRPSEALALTPRNIDIEGAAVIVRSLKKRGEWKGRHFRSIPVPRPYIDHLDEIHQLRRALTQPDSGGDMPLWRFSRTTAWRHAHTVMEAAGIDGVRACANGLRHTYGIHAALTKVPETRIKKWLGHASLATTEIYLDMAAPEDRAIARRMWN